MVKKAYPAISLVLLFCLLLGAFPLALAQEYKAEVSAASASGQWLSLANIETETPSLMGGHRDIATDSEWDALQRINALRSYYGKPPLAMAERLQPVAALRAYELDLSFSHIRPDDSAWYTAIEEAEISYAQASELIARPAVSGWRVVEIWAGCEDSMELILGDYSHIALAHNISTDTWCALLIQSEEAHTSLSLHPQGGRFLPFGKPLESLDLIAVAMGGIGMSYIPLTDAMVPIVRSGNVTLTFAWGGLYLHFTIFIDFSDVDESHRYYEHIRFAVTNHLFNGVSATKFAPDEQMTRAMFVTVLGRQARQMGLTIDGDHSIFADVEDGAWYTPYIGWAAARGIAQGSGGYFNPYDPVNREQMATFLLRFIHYAEIELPTDVERPFITDRPLVSGWAREAVDTAVTLGLINLREGENFEPGEDALRAEVAHALAVLVREHVN